MSTQNAIKDNNTSRSILGVNAARSETRQIVVGDSGGMYIEDAYGSDTAAYLNTDVDETEDLVVTGPQKLVGYFLSNISAGQKFVFLYDAADIASVIVGTTVPKICIPLAANQSANLSRLSIPFTNGIVIAATTALAGTGAPGANEVISNIFAKAAV